MQQHQQFQSYINHKLEMARRLGAGECGGTYSDACILVAALLSGISADMWPGQGRDKRRFVEIWARYGRSDLDAIKISVPLLVRRLRRKGKVSEASAIEAMKPKAFGPGQETRVLTGDEVDVSEAVIIAACPTLSLKEVRDRAYPVVFYEHVRSALVHEDHLDTRAVSVPMTNRVAGVSYSNVAVGAGVQRRIHFHLDWLLDLARSVAACTTPGLVPRPVATPVPWWCDG